MNPSGTIADQVLDPVEWVDAYGDYLYRHAKSRVRDANTAEEVLQETLLAGIRAQSQFAGRGSQRAWLLGILKLKIVDHFRDRARLTADGQSESDSSLLDRLFDDRGFWKDGAGTWSKIPRGDLESAELWQILEDCLTRLPNGQADVFVMSVIDETESEQICTTLGITSSNLWVRLHRARLRLASCVGAKWNADQDHSTGQ